jgi:hypothetical protein
LSACCSSSLISSYSSSSSLSSSVLLQRKSQGGMESGENNFLSQTQSFRQYIFAGSLSEYSGEKRELHYLTFPSTSGFIFRKWTNFVFFQTWFLDKIKHCHVSLLCIGGTDKTKQNKNVNLQPDNVSNRWRNNLPFVSECVWVKEKWDISLESCVTSTRCVCFCVTDFFVV